MWLVIICALSFVVGLLSFKTTFSKRLWINICTPIVLTLFVVVLPGLGSPDKYELLWRLISIPAALFCGIIAAFLSEIPIAIFSKRHRRADESGKKD
jgi:hypothetical protein